MGLRNLLVVACATFLVACHALAECPTGTRAALADQLSRSSSVNSTYPGPRWSEYQQPIASLYVRPGTEKDVASTIKFSNKNDYQFFVQNGGNGWANTIELGRGCSIIIDISSLKQVTFNADKTQATIQGGVLNEHLVDLAYGNDTRIANPTCPCLGFLGAVLGGGQIRTAGLYGVAVDSIISAKIVLASGDIRTVNATSNRDLFWAIKGSAANFGVVTSAVVKTYPTPRTQNIAWQATLTFPETKLKALLQALRKLDLKPHMQLDLLYSSGPAPTYTPQIQVVAFYTGKTSAAEKAFSSIFSIGPSNRTIEVLSYDHWNDFGEAFCSKGQRKPAYAASLANFDVATWQRVYEEYKRFVASDPEALGFTSVLAEYYPLAKAQSIGDRTSSYPFRNLPLHVIAIPWYADAKLDAKANAWGAKVRSLWWKTAGTERNSSYINFAHGDESLETIYGHSLSRLQHLKKIYDPENRFNQWFPLTPRD